MTGIGGWLKMKFVEGLDGLWVVVVVVVVEVKRN